MLNDGPEVPPRGPIHVADKWMRGRSGSAAVDVNHDGSVDMLALTSTRQIGRSCSAPERAPRRPVQYEATAPTTWPRAISMATAHSTRPSQRRRQPAGRRPLATAAAVRPRARSRTTITGSAVRRRRRQRGHTVKLADLNRDGVWISRPQDQPTSHASWPCSVAAATARSARRPRMMNTQR